MAGDEHADDDHAGDELRRSWTVDEANAALAWVAPVVARAQAGWDESAPTPGGGAPRAPERARLGARRPAPIQSCIDELAAEGIVLRDIARGLVDFPAAPRVGAGSGCAGSRRGVRRLVALARGRVRRPPAAHRSARVTGPGLGAVGQPPLVEGQMMLPSVARPELVLEQALVELARGVAGQLARKSTVRGHLTSARCSRQ